MKNIYTSIERDRQYYPGYGLKNFMIENAISLIVPANLTSGAIFIGNIEAASNM
jgi:hypothetical protein